MKAAAMATAKRTSKATAKRAATVAVAVQMTAAAAAAEVVAATDAVVTAVLAVKAVAKTAAMTRPRSLMALTASIAVTTASVAVTTSAAAAAAVICVATAAAAALFAVAFDVLFAVAIAAAFIHFASAAAAALFAAAAVASVFSAAAALAAIAAAAEDAATAAEIDLLDATIVETEEFTNSESEEVLRIGKDEEKDEIHEHRNKITKDNETIPAGKLKKFEENSSSGTIDEKNNSNVSSSKEEDKLEIIKSPPGKEKSVKYSKELMIEIENFLNPIEQKESPGNKENQTLNIISDSLESNIQAITNVTSSNTKCLSPIFVNKSSNEKETKFTKNESNLGKQYQDNIDNTDFTEQEQRNSSKCAVESNLESSNAPLETLNSTSNKSNEDNAEIQDVLLSPILTESSEKLPANTSSKKTETKSTLKNIAKQDSKTQKNTDNKPDQLEKEKEDLKNQEDTAQKKLPSAKKMKDVAQAKSKLKNDEEASASALNVELDSEEKKLSLVKKVKDIAQKRKLENDEEASASALNVELDSDLNLSGDIIQKNFKRQKIAEEIVPIKLLDIKQKKKREQKISSQIGSSKLKSKDLGSNKLQKQNIPSDPIKATNVAFAKARNEVEAIRAAEMHIRAKKELKKQENIEETPKQVLKNLGKKQRKEVAEKSDSLPSSSRLKRLPDDVVENLTDQPIFRAKRKRKYLQIQEESSPSVVSSKKSKTALSSFGSTTQFTVLERQKAEKQSSKSSSAAASSRKRSPGITGNPFLFT